MGGRGTECLARSCGALPRARRRSTCRFPGTRAAASDTHGLAGSRRLRNRIENALHDEGLLAFYE